jgi:hypothetical protein
MDPMMMQQMTGGMGGGGMPPDPSMMGGQPGMGGQDPILALLQMLMQAMPQEEGPPSPPWLQNEGNPLMEAMMAKQGGMGPMQGGGGQMPY